MLRPFTVVNPCVLSSICSCLRLVSSQCATPVRVGGDGGSQCRSLRLRGGGPTGVVGGAVHSRVVILSRNMRNWTFGAGGDGRSASRAKQLWLEASIRLREPHVICLQELSGLLVGKGPLWHLRAWLSLLGYEAVVVAGRMGRGEDGAWRKYGGVLVACGARGGCRASPLEFI